jgi:hypothetical protein
MQMLLTCLPPYFYYERHFHQHTSTSRGVSVKLSDGPFDGLYIRRIQRQPARPCKRYISNRAANAYMNHPRPYESIEAEGQQ